MRIVPLDDVEHRPRRVAVGTFDGVHLGHREVIRGADTVLTFDPHPACVVSPASAPRQLTTLERRASLVAGLGVRELVVIAFDDAFSARSAESFVDDVLVDRLGAAHVTVGENFHFGHRARGGPRMLQADGRFETQVVPLLKVDGEAVSSSRIRSLIADGAVEEAGRLLGEAFVLSGTVAHGEKRGRELGYPTANLVPDPRHVTPGYGVYACLAGTSEGSVVRVPAAVSVGVRPTFVTGLGELIEAYLLEWSGDLYGLEIELTWLRRLRGEERFDSVDDLVVQMARDVEDTRAAAERDAADRLLRFGVA
ncbi:MAG: bifunctional riboflavin kinase/FAD synthetase [Solirubrobacterales bacterium]|nr:bifunctional riboflavin kinase/FAD synthetase [Solirubrobacterales bacterium]